MAKNRLKFKKDAGGGPTIPDGFCFIGKLSAIRYSIVPKLGESHAIGNHATASASIPRNIYTMSDESGIMGKGQGPFYVMAVSVVSNWDIYGKLAPVDENGEYIKFNSAFPNVYEPTLDNIDSLLNRTYMIAIAKGDSVPKPRTQKYVHAAGILALANEIMRIERSQRIDSVIDYSTLTAKMPIELLYERNAYSRGRLVEANVDHAKSFGPLAMNDYVVGSHARWMNGGIEVCLDRLNTELYYCMTNIDEMERLGDLAVEAMRNNHDRMPEDDLYWTRLKLPDEKPSRTISKSHKSNIGLATKTVDRDVGTERSQCGLRKARTPSSGRGHVSERRNTGRGPRSGRLPIIRRRYNG